MTTTRAQLLEHLIGNLLGQDKSSALALALKEENVNSLADLMSLSDQDIEVMTYTEESEDDKDMKPKDVPRWAQRLLRVLQSYVHYQTSEGVTDLMTLTQADYDDYRIHVFNSNAPHTAPSPAARPTVSTSRAPGPYMRPPAEDFKKSIKRSKTDYKPFKEDKEWDN